MTDANCATTNAVQNRHVHAQLSAACTNGTANHSIKRLEDTGDGRAAWSPLIEFCDGDAFKDELVNDLKDQLINLKLNVNKTGSQFLNKFIGLKNKLASIPGEEMTLSSLQLRTPNLMAFSDSCPFGIGGCTLKGWAWRVRVPKMFSFWGRNSVNNMLSSSWAWQSASCR